ncbi:MAG: beta-lactamase family protein [Ilumatobacteraceae bacterium]|nr:beta-lactamase family protein [Ilumatobacteraceae bacterium]
MRALGLATSWPPEHVSVAVIGPSGVVATSGDPTWPYRLASIAKVVTAWAALVAVEEGIVSLDHRPRHIEVQSGCTLRHLLSHAGGYAFDGPDPIAPPGTRRIYSNTGIELAAAEVAGAAEMPFADYLAAAVLEPLGMHATELRGSPAHALWSNLDDTSRFARELLRPTLISADTAADAIRPQFPTLAGIVPGVGRFSPCPWGLGTEIKGDKSPHWTGRANSPATFGHFGGSGTMMWVDPAVDTALVALSDLLFDEWADEALRRWPELSDAVLLELAEPAR